MVRTQIQIDTETYEELRRRAFAERKSFSAVVRELLGNALRKGRPSRARKYRLSFIGMVRGRKKDVSVRHDEYLGARGGW